MCDVIFVQAFSGAVYVFLYEETNLPRSQRSTCGKDRVESGTSSLCQNKKARVAAGF
jgi:hypothetical protein